MLRFLSIKRLAVIDSVEVEFDPGLNVLTGETGAGKSILVEAVGLLLGGRASGDLVRTGEDVATVEAIFESSGEELLVRREITAQGRSRAFINGELATAGALKELSARLIELHGQHEHQTLLDPSTHVAVLDAFGGLERLAAPAAAAFEAVRASVEELARLKRAVVDRGARRELVAFQLAELERAALKAGEPGEDVELTAARQVLASAERVERLCAESYASLYESDEAILAGLGGVWRRVAELAALDPRFQQYLDARDEIKSQLEDLALFLRRYADGIEASPARLQEVEERLALLERLKRKYGPTLTDAIARRDALRRELSDLEPSDQRIAALERDHAVARGQYLQAAQVLSKERRRVAVEFSGQLQRLLGELAMERTRLEARFTAEALDEPAWTAQGIDQAEFFLSPNPGEELRPLARIVSGGELSRVMLAIKTLTLGARLAGTDAERGRPSSDSGRPERSVEGWGTGGPGLIFDEVDAGIGGRVADVVGRKLRALGSTFQVLCITHLPQIAAYADTHFQIEKRVDGGRTRTAVLRLDEDARVEEIGRMLGGTRVGEGIRASAREMLARQAPRLRSGQAPRLRSGQVGKLGASPSAPLGAGELKPKGESERAKAKPRSSQRG
ncbi:MAG: DNA repair protein RecN [Acidobacteria bacterium]|nr:DNA repair protein RecN [Acidobacteriota bacterium]